MRQAYTILAVACFLLSAPLSAASYWVQVAAYGEKVSDGYFNDAGIKGAIMHLDKNLIYRYYVKGFNSEETAMDARDEYRSLGFRFARVVDIDKMKKACAEPCPESEPKPKLAKLKTELKKGNPIVKIIHFDYDRTQLLESSRKVLDTIKQIVQENPEFEIQLNGHTDSRGSESYNQNLSARRALQANHYLTSIGVESYRLKTDSYGEGLPVAKNALEAGEDAPEGRRLNRRVEIIITPKGMNIPVEDVHMFMEIPSYLKKR